MRKIEVYELSRSEEIANVPPVLDGGIILIFDLQSKSVYEKDMYGNITISSYIDQFIVEPPVSDTITFSTGVGSHTFPNTLAGSWDAIIHLYRHKSSDEYRVENLENIYNPLMLPEDQKTKYNPDIEGNYTDEWAKAF